ncbi:RNA polymerase sigma factor [Aureliella helgolandensis]|uniref:RNA polymerase sigma factor n=1 Tax=Aureliella helgolandensis TaxID=2527968 RepID=UPI0011A896E2|nr:sigma factor-like helix-turn-helix DNA-binding protein [Aureliella helgolandensis]
MATVTCQTQDFIVELPSQEYEVVSYRYLNGFSICQISEETQRPIGTITKQLSRAVHRMREIVAELER